MTSAVRVIQPELSLSTENRFHEIPIVYKKPETLLMLTTAQNVKTEATYQCEICGKQLKNSQKYQKHISQVHKTLEFVCKICMAVFKTKTNLNRHNNSHIDPTFGCEYCKQVRALPLNEF